MEPEPCPTCNGSGTVWYSRKGDCRYPTMCRKCNGSGIKREEKKHVAG